MRLDSLPDPLLQQAQHGAAALVRLREHGLRRLRDDVILREGGHFLRHIRIADRRFRRRDVLVRRHDVRICIVHAARHRAEGRLLGEHLLDRIVERTDRGVRARLTRDVDGLAVLAREAERIGAHIREAEADTLVRLRAHLERHRVVRRGILRANRLGEVVHDPIDAFLRISLRILHADCKTGNLSIEAWLLRMVGNRTFPIRCINILSVRPYTYFR